MLSSEEVAAAPPHLAEQASDERSEPLVIRGALTAG